MSLSPPSPPTTGTINNNATDVANVQQGFNVAGQAGSQYNQYNPYGSLNYVQTGVGPNGVPTYSAVENLSPQQQQLLNTYTGTQNSAGNQGASLIGNANYGAQSPGSAIGNMTSGITSQILGQETNYLNPFFSTQSSQLDAQLKNEGLQPGNPAYDNAMRGLQTNQGLTVSNFLAQAEPQAYQQAETNYLLPEQLGTSLAQFGAPTTPNGTFTTNTPGLQPSNEIGAVQAETGATMQPYQAQLANYSNMMSGLFGTSSALLGGLAMGGFI